MLTPLSFHFKGRRRFSHGFFTIQPSPSNDKEDIKLDDGENLLKSRSIFHDNFVII